MEDFFRINQRLCLRSHARNVMTWEVQNVFIFTSFEKEWTIPNTFKNDNQENSTGTLGFQEEFCGNHITLRLDTNQNCLFLSLSFNKTFI